MDLNKKRQKSQYKNENSDWEEESMSDNEEEQQKETFLGTYKDLKEGEHLEITNEAYLMYHKIISEQPCLSIDFLNHQALQHSSNAKIQFPLDTIFVSGSQSEKNKNNFIYLTNVRAMEMTKYNDYRDEGVEIEEPIVIVNKTPINTSVNWIWSMNGSSIVALMGEDHSLQIFDLENELNKIMKIDKKDDYIYQGQAKRISSFDLHQEGYGLDFSKSQQGLLATGNQNGNLNIFQAKNEFSSFEQLSQMNLGLFSIEDLQFSLKEAFIIACACTDGSIRIIDTRSGGPISSIKAHSTDVNVISWNQISSNLLASGSDSGEFKIWDLRYINNDSLITMHWHKEPIYSIQWSHQDDWSLAVGAGDNSVTIWDFSVEKDDQDNKEEQMQIPEQLLFIHQGMDEFKELRWSEQIANLLLTTSLDGYNIFSPDINENEESDKSPNDMEVEY